MVISLEQPVQKWAAQFPRTVEAIGALHEAGARVALSASRLTQLVAEATDQPIWREPDDTDLLIPHEDLGLAASVLGARVERDKRIRMQTGDGLTVRFAADEVVAHADSSIQMVCPTTSIRVGTHRYDTAYTPFAAKARDLYVTEQGVVPVAVTDAYYLYGIFQRENPDKSDRYNAAILKPAHDSLDPYALHRAYEMGINGRSWVFMLSTGATAVRENFVVAA